MKWRKLGKIFDPARYGLADGCTEYAKSPQAVVFDNYIRIYFSSQKRIDEKYLSYVQFIDIDKEFKNILNISKETPIKLGNLGAFDEHGIFPFNVIKYQGKLLAYICGWSRRKSVSIDMAIGAAKSEDGGTTFSRLGDGPVLTASLHEPFLVGDGFVRVYDGVFHMWYIYGNAWRASHPGSNPDRTYIIAHATSADGINWIKEGRNIIEQKYPLECQALPTVIKIENRYHMYFCRRHSFNFRNNPDYAYRLGYAYSDDLTNWTRADEKSGIDTSKDDWDSDMICYPNLFDCDGKTYLLYNGNEFGKYGFGIAELMEWD
ncbi:MAG TPA: hypothetical protein DER10_03655 [Elusimicrobia bacterium]|nr:hypothetical protein [Elusimicrobiota bacterium]HCE97574.1 hypothetical protein [Elusimicrobiota bacterium]